MEKLINIIKFKMNKKYLYIILILGVALMLASGFKVKEKPESEVKSESTEYIETLKMEERLENILSKIDGVGSVNVMITYDTSPEKIAVSNDKISTKKEDENIEKEVVMKSNGSNKEPFISKEIKPLVRGVLIVAEGAENSSTRINLIRAVSSVLDVTVNKVEVLPKNKEE